MKIVLNGEFTIKQRIQRERWKEEQYYPMLEKLKAGKAVYELPEGSIIDFKINPDDNPHLFTEAERLAWREQQARTCASSADAGEPPKPRPEDS